MPIDLARVRALCFDVDGTLSDTDDLWVSRLEKTLQPARRVFTRAQFRPLARRMVMTLESPGNALYHWLDHLGWDRLAGQVLSWFNRRQPRQAAVYWVVPGAVDAVTDLAQRFPLAVISARGERGIVDFLNAYHLRTYFKSIVTAQTCRYTKPFPDPLIFAAGQMDVAPEACLMVGDTTVDIKTGQSAGAQTIGVLCGFGSETELRRAGADLILPGPADVAALFSTAEPPSIRSQP